MVWKTNKTSFHGKRLCRALLHVFRINAFRASPRRRIGSPLLVVTGATLLGTSASLLVTSALLVVTMFATRNKFSHLSLIQWLLEGSKRKPSDPASNYTAPSERRLRSEGWDPSPPPPPADETDKRKNYAVFCVPFEYSLGVWKYVEQATQVYIGILDWFIFRSEVVVHRCSRNLANCLGTNEATIGHCDVPCRPGDRQIYIYSW